MEQQLAEGGFVTEGEGVMILRTMLGWEKLFRLWLGGMLEQQRGVVVGGGECGLLFGRGGCCFLVSNACPYNPPPPKMLNLMFLQDNIVLPSWC